MDTLKQHEFVALIQQHRNIVAQVCIKYCPNNMTPDELIDEVISEAWEAWLRFRGDSKSSTWLYAVARNVSIDRLRKFLAGPQIISIDPRNFQMAPIKDESYAERELIFLREQRAHEIFSVLSDKETDLIILYAQGKSYREMEQITGWNQSRLRVRVMRIKQRLKEAYPNYR